MKTGPRKTVDFEGLSDPQLLALSPEEIARIVDLRCAEAGIPLAEPPPAPDLPPIAEDMTGYTIGELNFVDRDDAEKIATLANTMQRLKSLYISGPSFKQKWIPANDDPVKVATVMHYSERMIAELGDRIRWAEEAKAEYTKARETYEQAARRRNEIATTIEKRISAARLQERTRSQLRAAFAKYLDLADGQHRIAAKFMLQAYPDARKLVPDIFDEPIDTTPNKRIDRSYRLNEDDRTDTEIDT